MKEENITSKRTFSKHFGKNRWEKYLCIFLAFLFGLVTGWKLLHEPINISWIEALQASILFGILSYVSDMKFHPRKDV